MWWKVSIADGAEERAGADLKHKRNEAIFKFRKGSGTNSRIVENAGEAIRQVRRGLFRRNSGYDHKTPQTVIRKKRAYKNLKRKECFYKWNKLTSRSTLTWARALKHLSPQPTKRNRIVALLWALLCSSGMLCRCFYSVCSLLVSSIILTQEVTLKQCALGDSHRKISAF